MKLLLFAAGLLCLIGVARGCDEEQLVREVVFVTDYNNGDFKNAPSYTTDDWVHINPGGGIRRGREEVLKEVRAIHKTMLKESFNYDR
jgi:ketosteroid isomerase-like protein